MDEIRCPMCGNLNPADLEECQYCQARLKPLIVSQPPEDEPAGHGQAPSSSAEGESLPDWLQDLRMDGEDVADQEGAESEGEIPLEEADEVDWLSRLQNQSLPADEEYELEEIEEEPFDDGEFILDRLGDTEQVSKPQGEDEELIPETQEAEVVWPSSAQPSDEDELPEWLSEVGSEAESSDQDEAEPFSELPGDEKEPWIFEQAVPSQEEEPLPDWMADIESVEEGERPGWMPETDIEAMESEPEEFDEESPPEKDEEEEAGEPAEEPAEEPEQPAWLEGLEGERLEKVPPFEEKPEAETEEFDIQEAELPDWLVDLQEDKAEEDVEELPDWLAAGEAEAGAEVEQGLPDWLASSEEEPAAEVSQEEVPEWLVDIEEEGVEEGMSPLGEEAAEQFEGEETPEWLSEIEGEYAEEGVPAFVLDGEGEDEVAGEAPPLTSEEEGEDFLESLPEWAEEVSIEEETAEEALEPELEEAELPSWLEAMRPVETVAPEMPAEEIGDEKVESIGPLAGLSGILAAESDFARVRKPPTYSVKLRVTDNQQARMALLKEMLTAEDKQKTIPAQLAITPQYIFRLVIALVLIVPIFFVSGSTLTPMPQPASVPSGVLDASRLIDNRLGVNSPVLIGFDYEAGFSGELDIPTNAVISDLMDRGAYLTLVSTSPSGPMVAERLIDGMNQTSTRQDNQYSNYANMGYIPGGTTGLLSLAQSPRSAVPYTLDDLEVWGSEPLNLISSVADFSMVVVLTENPETARAWIEQVQPFLEMNETPMIMVVSAQAEPLVRPYYDGSPKQVNGLIVGLSGGAAYESITGQSSLARRSWDAFSLSMLIAELILIVGVVVSLGMMLYKSTKKEEG